MCLAERETGKKGGRGSCLPGTTTGSILELLALALRVGLRAASPPSSDWDIGVSLKLPVPFMSLSILQSLSDFTLLLCTLSMRGGFLALKITLRGLSVVTKKLWNCSFI